jgi:Bacterial regulatory protein, Fis family
VNPTAQTFVQRCDQLQAQLNSLAAEIADLRHSEAMIDAAAEVASLRTQAGIIPLTLVEKRAIAQALNLFPNDRNKVAQLLGIGKTTLYRKIDEYGWFKKAAFVPHEENEAMSTAPGLLWATYRCDCGGTAVMGIMSLVAKCPDCPRVFAHAESEPRWYPSIDAAFEAFRIYERTKP